MLARLGEIRSKLSTAFPQVTLVMMTTPRYRHMANRRPGLAGARAAAPGPHRHRAQ
jgi:hypothetical protein